MEDPTLEQLGDMPGYTLLEFGTSWCTYCQAAQPLIAEAMHLRNDIRHLRIEDGKGKRLGRQFGGKLWPTLVLLNAGEEVDRCVRPQHCNDLEKLLNPN